MQNVLCEFSHDVIMSELPKCNIPYPYCEYAHGTCEHIICDVCQCDFDNLKHAIEHFNEWHYPKPHIWSCDDFYNMTYVCSYCLDDISILSDVEKNEHIQNCTLSWDELIKKITECKLTFALGMRTETSPVALVDISVMNEIARLAYK